MELRVHIRLVLHVVCFLHVVLDQVSGGKESYIRSDFLNLYLAPSTLSGDNVVGVFAAVEIPAENLLCEYRGVSLIYAAERVHITH